MCWVEEKRRTRVALIKSLAVGVLCLVLLSCGRGDEEPEVIIDYKEQEYFDPPTAQQVLAPRWVRVSQFGVHKRPEYDAFIEVAVVGMGVSNGLIRCEIVTDHRRFRDDRAWSPLPIAFFSLKTTSEDGREDLNTLFRDTLDFENSQFDSQKISVKVSFTRGKTFTANWQITPLLVMENGTQVCSAIASVSRSAQVECKTDRCKIYSVTAEVDAWRNLTQRWKPVREIDDLSALFLDLEDIDSTGLPTGNRYTAFVSEFK